MCCFDPWGRLSPIQNPPRGFLFVFFFNLSLFERIDVFFGLEMDNPICFIVLVILHQTFDSPMISSGFGHSATHWAKASSMVQLVVYSDRGIMLLEC